jgi:cytochrome P450
LSDKPELQKKIREEVKATIYSNEHIDFTTFDNSEFYNLMTKETLRIFNPFILSAPRQLIKDAKIGKYKFKKGVNLIIPILTMHRQEKFHKKAMEFDMNRHTQENKMSQKKMTNMPFFVGRRNCIGQYMGELMLKLMISQLVMNFEFKRDPDYKPRMIQDLTYIHEEMNLWLKPIA